MIGLIRAFAWLRWRLLVNSFKGSRRRDALERFSRAGSVILPIVLLVLFIPTLLVAAVGAVLAGWGAGSGRIPVQGLIVTLRVLFGLITVVVIVAPAVRSVREGATNLSRFVLLPIPRGLLFATDALSGLSDPWLLLVVPILLLLPVGIALSGQFTAAALALAGGIVMLALLLGLEASVSHGLSLLYRNRRRGEAITLLFLMALSCSSLLPLLMSRLTDRRDRPRPEAASHAAPGGDAAAAGSGGPVVHDGTNGSASTRTTGSPAGPGTPGDHPEAGAGPDPKVGPDPKAGTDPPANTGGADATGANPDADGTAPTEVDRPQEQTHGQPPQEERSTPPLKHSEWSFVLYIPAIGRVLPSEFYGKTVGLALTGSPGSALLRLAGLMLMATVLGAAGWTAYGRLMSTPEVSGSYGKSRRVRLLGVRFPGLTAAASAVALAYVRLILRSLIGKMSVYFSPLSVIVVLILLMRVGGGGFRLEMAGQYTGPLIAVSGMYLSMVAVQKIMLNQFAIDRAGLTLQLLSPITGMDLVVGKAAGAAILLAGPAILYMIVPRVLSPAASIWLWGCAPLVAASAFALFAPVSAVLSALFPKTADLNRMGSSSNPSTMASILGFFAISGAFAPPVALAGFAAFAFDSRPLAFLVVAVWAVLSILSSLALFRLAARTVDERRENLALVAQGR